MVLRGFGCARPWLLTLLHLLLLGSMLLLQLLGLLSVALFHLLFLRIVDVFLGSLLVFLFLLLLDLLVFLVLFGDKLVLLLLVFLICCGIASIWRRGRVRLKFTCVTVGRGFGCGGGRSIFGVSCRASLRRRACFCRWPSFGGRGRLVAGAGCVGRRSLVRAASLSGGYYSGLEISRFGSRGDGRLALIVGGAQFGIGTGLLDVLRLGGDTADVLFLAVGFFLRRGTRFDATSPAVIAHTSGVIFNDG